MHRYWTLQVFLFLFLSILTCHFDGCLALYLNGIRKRFCFILSDALLFMPVKFACDSSWPSFAFESAFHSGMSLGSGLGLTPLVPVVGV